MALVEIDAAAMQEFQIFLLKAPTPLMLLRELLKGGSMAWRRFPVPPPGHGIISYRNPVARATG